MRHALRHDQDRAAFLVHTKQRAVRNALASQPGYFELEYTDATGRAAGWDCFIPGADTRQGDYLMRLVSEVER